MTGALRGLGRSRCTAPRSQGESVVTRGLAAQRPDQARPLAFDRRRRALQMPAGIPVATVAVGGARNAGLLAVRILGAGDGTLRAKMAAFQERLRGEAEAKGAALRARAEQDGGPGQDG